ncbi:helix-turn-helix transcriptional regulator [Paracoccus shanxieyensis]|uniref:AlpA family phage regulatory protein n=1 Tax=Paracoccus shanxieyensis TaxID=2675752 RepID=A0A6L6J1W0_9RHOB|nr:AlpA family phage regulatory protein [Paracoccus shanxieyensis]MTH66745.1 AlpA family phage regulatory protein [Paracoccus shanxieyensis]MTH89980.1 AlpA family phage regulatory protein [Paracoccus shanxieyensis]
MERKFVSVKFLTERYECSRETIYKYMRDYGFPQQIKLTPGSARWDLAEVEAWEAARVAG